MSVMERSSTSKFQPTAVYMGCPYLRRFDDPTTWATFAYPEHACYHAGKQFIDPEYQMHICLGDAHTTCPVFQHQGEWPGALPEGISAPKTPRVQRLAVIVTAAVVLLSISVALLMLALSPPKADTVQEPTYQSQRTEAAAGSAERGSPRPTATRYTVATRTPRPPYTALVIELVFEANLRESPSLDSVVLARLPSSIAITVIGRTSTGDWLYIETSDGRVGWISGTQIDRTIDLSGVPVISIDSTPRSTIAATSAPAENATHRSAATSTQIAALPSRFEIVLSLEPATSTCSIGGYDLRYEFRLSLTRISITGLEQDQTHIEGSYDAQSGEFAASGSTSAGYDSIRGTILFDGATITVIGSRTIEYEDPQCKGNWDIYGFTTDW
jgi:hypothetical protein